MPGVSIIRCSSTYRLLNASISFCPMSSVVRAFIRWAAIDNATKHTPRRAFLAKSIQPSSDLQSAPCVSLKVGSAVSLLSIRQKMDILDPFLFVLLLLEVILGSVYLLSARAPVEGVLSFMGVSWA